MARFTLERMIRGGHQRPARAAASAATRWTTSGQIPHFEKMLYDNGPLLALCCDVPITGDALFRDAARDTADWLMREMQSPEGRLSTPASTPTARATRARFYVWDREQVRALLTPPSTPSSPPSTGWTGRPTSRVGLAPARLADRRGRRRAPGAGAQTPCRRLLDRPGHAARGARAAASARAGRQGPDRLERARHQGHGARRPGPGSAGLSGVRRGRRWTSSVRPCGGTGACSPPTRTARAT